MAGEAAIATAMAVAAMDSVKWRILISSLGFYSLTLIYMAKERQFCGTGCISS